MRLKKKPKRKLTIKQQKFAKLYAASGNATQSAKLAGYSKKAAYAVAHETLKNPEVKRAIHETLEESLAKAQLKSDHVVEQLRRIAFSDLAEAYRIDGTLKHPLEMSDETKAFIHSIEIDEITLGGKIKIGEKKKLKMHDKTKALELLGRTFGIFKDVVEQKNTNYTAATPEQVDQSTEKFKDKL